MKHLGFFLILWVGICVDGKLIFEFVGDGIGIVITEDGSFVNVTNESLFVVCFNDERALFDDECRVRDFENIIDSNN